LFSLAYRSRAAGLPQFHLCPYSVKT
jgi:hypothetical protein